MDKTVITNNATETQKLGEECSKYSDKKFFALFGDLGSGKTTFTQGFAKGLGIKGRIISPTFIIVRQHKISSKYYVSSIKYFYHIDLYRIESEKDLKGLGLEEIFNNPENVIVVEWAEKIKHLLPKKRIEIYFEYVSSNERKITFKNYE